MPKGKEKKVKMTAVMSTKAMEFVEMTASQNGISRSSVINEILELMADSGILEVMKDLRAKQEEEARKSLRVMADTLAKDIESVKKEI